MTNTANAPLSDIILKGNTSQEGTPTPDSPQDIHTVSGDNTINICGKNLLKLTNETKTDRGITGIISNDNVLTYSGTATGPYSNCTTEIPFILPSGTYTFSIDHATTNNERIVLYLSGGTSQTIVIMGGKTSNAFTSNGTNTTMRVGITSIASGTSYSDTVKMQLEKNSTQTTYEPYQGNTYNIDLPEDMELCKIGTYQDRIYKDNGKWYKYGAIGKIVLDRSEDYGTIAVQASTGNTNMVYIFTTILDNVLGGNLSYCNLLLNSSSELTIATNSNNEMFSVSTSWAGTRFYIDKTRLSAITIQAFKEWLASNKPIIYYILKTPTITEITDSTLISQLNALYNAYTYNDTTNITQTNANLPFIINAEAFKKIS